MNTIIICAIIFVLVGAYIGKKFDKTIREGYNPVKEWAITGAFFGVAVGLAAAVCLSFAMPRIIVEREPLPLVAVTSAQGVSGTFVSGSGSIHSHRVYDFLVRYPDGSISPEEIPANGLVRIVEDKNLEDVGYWVITVSKIDKSSALSWWAFDITPREEIVSYDFRVPVGSVKQTFSFN